MPRKDKPGVTVLIPTINEGESLHKVVNECLKINTYSIIVFLIVDSKANSETRKAAKKSKAKVFSVKNGNGKGSVIRFGIPHIKTDYIVQIDADYQFMPSEIPAMVEPLLHGYDVTLGTRYQKGSKMEVDSVSHTRLIGSYGLSLITSFFARQRVTDVMAGFKGFKTTVLKDLNPQVDHFGYEAELVIRAAQKGYKITNVPITYKKRLEGKTNLASIKHGLLVLQTIIQTAFN